jgi:hypothetical protein
MSDNIDQSLSRLDLAEPSFSPLPKSDENPQIKEDVSVINCDQDKNVVPFHEPTTLSEASTISTCDSPTSIDNCISIFGDLVVNPQHSDISLSTVISLGHTDTLDDDTASDTSNIPQLPTELMIKIFKFAQGTSLTSLLRTSKLNYSLVWPMIFKDKTLHLNRETLPGLATFMSTNLTMSKEDTRARKKQLNLEKKDILERRRQLLAGITTLVIDDVQVMFERKWHVDFAKFCSRIVLPNVTKIIWREVEPEKIAKPLSAKQLYTARWRRNSEADAQLVVGVELRVLHPRRLVPVLPAKIKEVCIVVPASGYFQDLGLEDRYHYTRRPWYFWFLTIERINEYVANFTGDVLVRVHQPVSDRHISISHVPNTIYSFYPDCSDAPAKARLVDAFYEFIQKRMGPGRFHWTASGDLVENVLSDILKGTLKREEMLNRCTKAIREESLSTIRWAGENDRDTEKWLLGIVAGFIALLHSDHDEVVCGCCGARGISLKAWKPQIPI